jgi:hypothetical protein
MCFHVPARPLRQFAIVVRAEQMLNVLQGLFLHVGSQLLAQPAPGVAQARLYRAERDV